MVHIQSSSYGKRSSSRPPDVRHVRESVRLSRGFCCVFSAGEPVGEVLAKLSPSKLQICLLKSQKVVDYLNSRPLDSH